MLSEDAWHAVEDVADALVEGGINDNRNDRGMQSEYMYATWLEEGSEPGLSHIEIFDKVFTDIPKLHHMRNIGARITSTSSQSIPSGTVTQVTFNSIVYDTASMSNLSNNRITCTRNGLYDCSFFFRANPGSQNRFQVRIEANGEPIVLDDRLTPGGTLGFNCSTNFLLEEGDHLTAHCFQTSGSGVSSDVGLGAPALTVSMLQPSLNPGDQLLCLRTRAVPLLIVGVLSGNTV